MCVHSLVYHEHVHVVCACVSSNTYCGNLLESVGEFRDFHNL